MADEMKDLKLKLDVLQTELQSLQTNKLPGAASSLIKTVLKSLAEVSGGLSEGQEQARLAALYQVSSALGTSLNLDEVLQQVMDAVISLTGAERGFLLLQDEGEELKVRIGRNMDQEELDGEKMSFSRTVVRTVIKEGEGVLTTNAQDDPRFAAQESVIGMALRSIMCAPLLSRDQVIGAIYVENRAKAGLFQPDTLEMMNAFASQASAAIQNAQLYTKADRSLADRVQELEYLAQAAREMNRHVEFEDVFETARQWALKGTGAEAAWVAMCEPEKDMLVETAGPEPGREIGKDDPLVKNVLEANTPHLFPPEGDTPARIAVPILVEKVCMAVMVLESPRAFPAEDLNFATRLGNQAAIAIDKAGLYDRIEAQKLEQTEFVSVVSHELRLPMTSIQGYTDLLKQGAMGEVNEQQLQFLTVIRSNVGRMSALISDLSDIYKVQGGRMALEPEMVSMREAVEQAAAEKVPSIEERGQAVDNQIDANLPKAFADANRVVQVVEQLLRNASLYSPEGGKIEVRGALEEGKVRVSVRDEGIGITEDEKPQVFSQFFRSERQDVRDHHGWGLGLALAQSLVGLMGGEMGFESEADVGSTFWFTLPTG